MAQFIAFQCEKNNFNHINQINKNRYLIKRNETSKRYF